MPSSKFLKAARAYAAADMAVFPCHPGTKKPACPNGHKEATTDPAQIEAWWAENENFNVGFDPHSCGWSVVDIEAGGSFETPETYTIATPNGGEHRYFDGELPSTVRKLGPKIDTRGSGTGYVLLPPSIVDGKRYKLLRDLEVAPVPQSLVDALKPRTKAQPTASHVELDTPSAVHRAVARLKLVQPAVEGEGSDHAAYVMAGEMKDLGLSETMALGVMMEHWQCDAKDEWWVAEKVANAYTFGQNAPGVHAVQPGSKVFKAPPGGPTTRGTDVVETDTHFLWYPYIPAGSISLLCGRGGQGKGLVASSLAASVTAGSAWPGGTEQADKGRVLWCEAEDDPRRTLKPRWIAAGVDCTQIELVRPETFPQLNLKDYIAKNDIRLVVFSPVVSFLAGLQDINAELGVRAALQLVQDAIEDTNCAAIGIAHINKKNDIDAIDRVLGSVAWTNFTRSVLFIAPDEDDDTKRRFAHAKYNLSVKGADLLYCARSVDKNVRGQRVRVDWSVPEGNVDAGAIYDRRKKKEAPATEEAAAWLRTFLADGPKASIEVWEAGRNHGHSEYALRQAAKKIGTKASKKDMQAGWIMSLPASR